MPKPNEVRDKLIDEISKTIMVDFVMSGNLDSEDIADFILERDKKISQVTCPHCWGGHKPPFNSMVNCPKCQGLGVVVKEGK